MQEKSVTLTPNKRLARDLQKQFCLESSEQNQATWHSTKILPLATWLINCWQEYNDPRILLSSYQEKLLWQKIITTHLKEKSSSLIDLAINFNELINSWQIDHSEIFSHETEEMMIFQIIYEKFKAYCKEKNFVTISELPTILLPYITNSNFTKIKFVGFDEYSPQLQTLISTAKKNGCAISKIDPNNYNNPIQKRISFNKLKEEIASCAKWSQKIFSNNPKASIGIVVPNLITLRSKIHQIFTEVFGDTKNINISAGIPLICLPIINSAIELLSINESSTLKDISNFLSSPYILGSEIECFERELFKLQLNQLEHLQFTHKDINNLVDKYAKNIPIAIKILQEHRDVFLPIQNKMLYSSKWVEIFAQILKIFGWPGENNLTDLEASASKHLAKSLQEIATSDLIIGKISYKKALQLLREVAINNVLQPIPENDAQINIIGTLEAMGINFDYLWIMGVDQENWPATPKPNPFIPVAIQKKLSLPHSSAQRELYFCDELIKRYKRSAKEVIFSHVRQSDDRIIEPSSLIADIPEINYDALKLDQNITWAQKIYHSQNLETLENDLAPKLAPNEITHAGSRLIELQSLCPFRAFMEFRLLTKEPQKSSLGISKINRGILIHTALEFFWRKVKTHQDLCSLNSDKLQKLIQNSVEYALEKLSLPQPLYKLEKPCLISLLTHWIEIEKTREPFQVIATEKSIQIHLASIPIKLRIDRIDQLADGKKLLIDYKTGKDLPSIFDLFGPRPKSPQLLLYSLAINTIEGLALAQINIGTTRLKEINLDELIFGLHAKDAENYLENEITWQKLIGYWENILTKISADFASGQASPTPLSPQVCKQCSFSLACRIVKQG
ncbi:MAG: PD-(D/E)XK nuclease family protein [Gammaproteobacteria bacterium]|nr:PD-(D/E)XK nuclease family protein [Gammaproteobacteria bacterium]